MGLKPRAKQADPFWSLIETHVRVREDGGIDASALGETLGTLSEPEVVAYERRLQALHQESRTWALWGAAHIIHGGCPDDTFDYFRSWLIGRGRAVFEAALRDPDSLATVATEEALDDELYSSGQIAYEAVTGRELEWDGAPYPALDESFSFDDEPEMQRRYPKLCRRFGAG